MHLALRQKKAIDLQPRRSISDRLALAMRRPLVLLTLITLLGGVLRFAWLDRPTVWGDEAASWSRSCGSFQSMLGTLRDQGLFMPGHYFSLWWLKEGLPYSFDVGEVEVDGREFRSVIPRDRLVPGGIWLEPFWLRLIPTLFGVAMVPAMYFLTRQLASRRTAIWAALFAACSAYLLAYSRDAKMYMQFWSLATLHMGCFFWWLGVQKSDAARRPLRLLPWLCWVASGMGMVWFAPLGLGLLLVQIVPLLTAPLAAVRDLALRLLMMPLRLTAFAIGAWLIATPVLDYYASFNQKDERVTGTHERPGLDERAWADQGQLDAHEAGLGWVEEYNENRGELEHVLFTATAWLFSWEWPRYVEWERIDLLILRSFVTATIVLGAVLAIGLAGLRGAAARVGLDRAHPPGRFEVRRMLWVIVWLVVPVYAVYCLSIPDARTPDRLLWAVLLDQQPAVDWRVLAGSLRNLDGVDWSAVPWQGNWEAVAAALRWDNLNVGGTLLVAVAMTGLLGWRGLWHRRAMRGLGLLGSVAAMAVLGYLVYLATPPQEMSLWMPRYPAMVWPAMAIMTVVLLRRLPTPVIRYVALSVLLGVNLASFAMRTHGPTEPPTHRMVQDLIDYGRSDRTWMFYRTAFGGGGAPGQGLLGQHPSHTAVYFHSILSRTPSDPLIARRGEGPGRIGRLFEYVGREPEEYRDRIRRRLGGRRPLERFVFWQELFWDDQSSVDPLEGRLPEGWRRVSVERVAIHDHWTWRRMGYLRRSVWERAATAAPPAAAEQP